MSDRADCTEAYSLFEPIDQEVGRGRMTEITDTARLFSVVLKAIVKRQGGAECAYAVDFAVPLSCRCGSRPVG
jgi:hypothetical protein